VFAIGNEKWSHPNKLPGTKKYMDYGKKSKLDILYLGLGYGTSRHRADALRRLGHKVDLLDPWEFFPNNLTLRKVLEKLIYEVGSAWLEPYVRRRLVQRLKYRHFNVIWNNQCELIGSTTALAIREHADSIVTYINDDPFGSQSRRRFSLLRQSLKHYDLNVVVRQPNVAEAYACGAAKVIRVFMAADEIAHRPVVLTPEEEKRWTSDVAFIGTWMPERGPFLARLMGFGIPLTIFGNRWQKSREWSLLKKAWRGPELAGDAYVKAIQTAKVCLGLLSKGNRDLHTQRSAEIPCIGSVLCAELTEEHVAMYRPEEEAVFWRSAEECAEKCFELLADESKLKAIAKAGRKRCLRSCYLNEPTAERVLAVLEKRKMLSANCHRKSKTALS
jgi:spore maturation protein CgeB